MTASERFEKIQDIFHATLKLPPAERIAFVHERCGENESLRKEVELLLSKDASPAGWLQDDSDENRTFRLTAGTRFGHYEISGGIGAGGMGEVYSARDSKLHREVALKMLPETSDRDPELVSRFQREAHLLASLNHPNIAAIYGLEESNHVLALVMELVEGPTLAERMAAGRLSIEEALTIARQIAEGLEAAHERGIIHRDLKPVNVKITPQGAVKILDFGLAKDMKADSRAAGPASPELSTRAGIILGTAPYMSPEQARGAAVDKRTDIWAFGVVLYEMLTHQRLFACDTTSDTLAAVLTKEPDWDRVPSKVQRLLRRCLEKEPRRRLRDIADAWALLEEPPQPSLPAKKSGRWLLMGAIAGALATAAAVALWMPWHAPGAERKLQSVLRLDVDLGSDVSLGSLRGADAIISPNGTRLVYVSKSHLFTRRLDQPNAIELPGTQDAYAPFFSPDGQWVAFFADYKLKKISVDGGPAIDICDAGFGNGGSWGEDGNIIASIDAQGLSRIPSNGGTPARITELTPGEAIHRWPQILPGGHGVLFSAYPSLNGLMGASIQVMSLTDHRRKTIQRGGTWARYLAAGDLMYVEKGTLLTVPFDLDRLEVSGPPTAVLSGIAYNTASGYAQIDFSNGGTVVYRSSLAGGGRVMLEWLDNAGKTRPLLASSGDYFCPTLSPDGNRLALISGGDIWVYDLRRGMMSRLTFDGGYSQLLWGPGNQYITFRAHGGISWIRADGSGKPEPLTRSKNIQSPWSTTPDGKRLAFVEIDPTTGADIWTVPIESDGIGLRAGAPKLFLRTPFNERAPAFSPDGRWLAYFSDESGKPQVYVRAFPDKGPKRQISIEYGSSPLWSRNGRSLFFRSQNSQLMVAEYTAKGDLFLAQKPRLWCEKKLGISPTTRGYDVAPDGIRVVAAMAIEDPEELKPQHHVIFLLNFFDELRRRVATSGNFRPTRVRCRSKIEF